MESNTSVPVLAALAHPDRQAIVRLLACRAPDAMRPAEILAALRLKANTLSNHLAALNHAGLVDVRRSGRNLFYTLKLQAIGALVEHLVADCCGGRPDACAPLAARHLVSFTQVSDMPDRPLNVLFICTGNSARSIMAEALLRDLGGGRFRGFSAGTKPAARPNNFALATLSRHGHDTSVLASKHITRFENNGEPRMDIVFTVCDAAAAEPCPLSTSPAITAHWGLPDPAAACGTADQREAAFEEAYQTLSARIKALVALPIDTMDRLELQRELDQISAQGAPVAETRAS